jgi:hypothetical protein
VTAEKCRSNVARLLPEIWNFETIKSLVQQCDAISPQHNALGRVGKLYPADLNIELRNRLTSLVGPEVVWLNNPSGDMRCWTKIFVLHTSPFIFKGLLKFLSNPI